MGRNSQALALTKEARFGEAREPSRAFVFWGCGIGFLPLRMQRCLNLQKPVRGTREKVVGSGKQLANTGSPSSPPIKGSRSLRLIASHCSG